MEVQQRDIRRGVMLLVFMENLSGKIKGVYGVYLNLFTMCLILYNSVRETLMRSYSLLKRQVASRDINMS